MSVAGLLLSLRLLQVGVSSPDVPRDATTTLQAGQLVTVELGAGGTLPNVQEAELVLSLDDGASFSLRVVGRLDPAVRSTTFRVPAVPCASARLGYRVGSRRGGERIAAISPRFRVEVQPADRLEPVVLRGGEVWTRDAALVTAVSTFTPGACLDDAFPRLESVSDPPDPDSDPPVLLPSAGGYSRPTPSRAAQAPLSCAAFASFPLTVPMRE